MRSLSSSQVRNLERSSPAFRFLLGIDPLEKKLLAGLLITVLLFAIDYVDRVTGNQVNFKPLFGVVVLCAFSLFGMWGFPWLLVAALRAWPWPDFGRLAYLSAARAKFFSDLFTFIAFAAVGLLISWLVRCLIDIQRSQQTLNYDLMRAAKMQEQILPPPLTLPWVTVAGKLRPAWELGGDFYLCEVMGKNKVFFAIGDIEGKGIAAAMTMAKITAIISNLCKECNSLDKLLEKANQHFCKVETTLVTVLVGTLTRLEQEKVLLTYAKAGHENGILIHGNGALAELSASGLPLGVLCSETYEERSLIIRAGAKLLFYTDGLVDARNSSEQIFAREQLAARATSLAGQYTPSQIGEWLDRLMDEVEASHEIRYDDMALLGLATTRA